MVQIATADSSATWFIHFYGYKCITWTGEDGGTDEHVSGQHGMPRLCWALGSWTVLREWRPSQAHLEPLRCPDRSKWTGVEPKY